MTLCTFLEANIDKIEKTFDTLKEAIRELYDEEGVRLWPWEFPLDTGEKKGWFFFSDIDSELEVPDELLLRNRPADEVEKRDFGGVTVYWAKGLNLYEIYDDTPGLVNSLFIFRI